MTMPTLHMQPVHEPGEASLAGEVAGDVVAGAGANGEARPSP